MDRHEIDDLECEANWELPHHVLAQLSLQKKERIERDVVRTSVLEILEWSEIEPWQTPYWPNHTRSITPLK